MKIRNIKLKNYRNHINAYFDFDENLTLVTGQNGTGKTNLLEAIYLVATAKSPRAVYDKDLINYEQKYCTIWADIENRSDSFELELQVIKGDDATNLSSKKAKVNKTPKAINAFTGIFNSVMFAPEDIDIITGSPSERRKFIDLLLSQTDPFYKKVLGTYNKAVKQRNKLLEIINETGRGYDQMEFWNQQLLLLGRQIHEKRDLFFAYASQTLENKIQELDSEKARSEIHYKKSEITRERLEKHHDHEIAAKSTLVGPHRDDFSITYNGYDVAEFGSRGQQRTILLSLKLTEIGFIEKTKGERPVLLLDDIFSELDDHHRQTVIETVHEQQTIVTSAETSQILGLTAAKTIVLP